MHVQAEALGAAPQLLLQGREVPRVLQDNNSFQSRSDSPPLRWLLHSSVSTHRRNGKADRRLLFQREAILSSLSLLLFYKKIIPKYKTIN